MSRGKGSSVIPVALFIALLLMVLPVSADNNTTQTNATPTATITTLETTSATPTSTVTTTQTANATPTSTVTTTQTTTATPKTTNATPQKTVLRTATTVAVTQPATSSTTVNPTTGNLIVYSSPPGASILIDGIYYGVTPDTVTGVPAGNHILRLSLSGYYDYEGSVYVGAGRTEQGYGTLQPWSQFSTSVLTAAPTVFVPVIVPVVTATSASADPGLLGNSSVVAAIIGAIAVVIASAATIFTHVKPPKKE